MANTKVGKLIKFHEFWQSDFYLYPNRTAIAPLHELRIHIYYYMRHCPHPAIRNSTKP